MSFAALLAVVPACTPRCSRRRRALGSLPHRWPRLPVDAYSSDVAMDASGNAVAVWNPTWSRVEAVDLDGAGPLLTKLSVPVSGSARSAVRFSVVPAPWGSPLTGSPTWEFGDGASASGSRVSHVYREVGRYTVMVRQSDATGAMSRSSATIAVSRPTLENSRRPSIRGVPRVGGVLTCLHGVWQGTQPIRYAYSWIRAGRAHARGTRYRVQSADLSARIACRVTATNPARTIAVTSRSVQIRR